MKAKSLCISKTHSPVMKCCSEYQNIPINKTTLGIESHVIEILHLHIAFHEQTSQKQKFEVSVVIEKFVDS